MDGRRRRVAGVAVVLLGLGAAAAAAAFGGGGDDAEPAAVVRTDEAVEPAASTTTTTFGEVVTGEAAVAEIDPATPVPSTTTTTVGTTTTTTAPPPPPTTTTTVVTQPAPCPVEAVAVQVTTAQADHGPGEPVEVEAVFRNDSGRDCAQPYSSLFVITDEAGNEVHTEGSTAGRVEGHVYRWPPGEEYRIRSAWRPNDHGDPPPPGRYVATLTIAAEDEQVRRTEYRGSVEFRLTAT